MEASTRKQLPRVTRERASDSVFEVLRDGILTQVFKPGERLNIPDLAARLDVSLTPVKEALNRLAAEGLVRIRPRSGTFVAELSPEDVAEMVAFIRNSPRGIAARTLSRSAAA